MELIEGPSLADQLEKGPLKLRDAQRIAIEIADALTAAHRAGIVHRDLKPGNIVLGPTGAKLLDFGLARRPAAASPLAATATAHTAPGVIMGTLPYMAPEQVKGRPTDARTDIFAFGCVLYEMLSGRRPFQGATAAALTAAILEHEPESIAQLDDGSGVLRRVLTRCLAKSPDDRWQSASDLHDALTWTASIGGRSPVASLPSASPRWIWAAGSVALLVVLAGAALWQRPRVAPPSDASSHVTVSLASAGLTLTTGGLAISPDGASIVFAARRGDDAPRLFVRRLDAWDVRALTGTEDAVGPFFSPDGSAVAFVANGLLKRTRLEDNAPQTICRLEYQGTSRGEWTDDGTIIVTRWPGGPLVVRAEGGNARPLGGRDGRYLWPQSLRDGQTILFTKYEHGRARIITFDTRSGVEQTLVENAEYSRYLSTGHLVYEVDGRVYAAPFDAERLRLTGAPRIVLDDVAVTNTLSTGLVGYDVSRAGTLVYTSASSLNRLLVWKDRSGRTVPLPLKARQYSFPSLSADGQRLTVTSAQWPDRAVLTGRVDREPLSAVPPRPSCCSIFSRDGKWVILSSNFETPSSILYRTRADGSGLPERLAAEIGPQQKPTSISPGGDRLLFNSLAPGNDRDILESSSLKAGPSRPFLRTPANELEATFSPDGKWIAYQSDESGAWEVYVRPFAGEAERQRVSIDGGTGPVWNPRGGELFYQTRTELMAVRIAKGVPLGPPVRILTCRREDYRREWMSRRMGSTSC